MRPTVQRPNDDEENPDSYHADSRTRALTGSHNGKHAVGELWGKFMSKDFRTEPHDFVAEGDKVVVLTTVQLEGESIESADVLTYNGNGKLVAFDTRHPHVEEDRVVSRIVDDWKGRRRRPGKRRGSMAASIPDADPTRLSY